MSGVWERVVAEAFQRPDTAFLYCIMSTESLSLRVHDLDPVYTLNPKWVVVKTMVPFGSLI